MDTGWPDGHSVVTVIYHDETGMPAPDYVKCKESLVTRFLPEIVLVPQLQVTQLR